MAGKLQLQMTDSGLELVRLHKWMWLRLVGLFYSNGNDGSINSWWLDSIVAKYFIEKKSQNE